MLIHLHVYIPIPSLRYRHMYVLMYPSKDLQRCRHCRHRWRYLDGYFWFSQKLHSLLYHERHLWWSIVDLVKVRHRIVESPLAMPITYFISTCLSFCAKHKARSTLVILVLLVSHDLHTHGISYYLLLCNRDSHISTYHAVYLCVRTTHMIRLP